MRAVHEPIIVLSKDELCVFESIESAEQYMEAIDVKNGEYLAAYDSEGRRFQIRVVRRNQPALFGLLSVEVEFAKLVETDDRLSESDYCALLKDWLGRALVGPEKLENRTLTELLSIAHDVALTR